MTYTEVMKALKASGTEQTRKTYSRHGVEGPMFGVSYAALEKLRKRIKIDHALALKLWSSRNHDARVLATMVADPEAIESRVLDAWVKELDNYVVTGAFAGLAAKSGFVRKKMEKWTRSKREWVGTAGWSVLARLALDDDSLPDRFFEPYLKKIESEIHRSKNRVRYAMNNAVIAIGVRSSTMERKAVAAAGRIGKVEVDHGETGCKTPDAVGYIRKTRAHRRAR